MDNNSLSKEKPNELNRHHIFQVQRTFYARSYGNQFKENHVPEYSFNVDESSCLHHEVSIATSLLKESVRSTRSIYDYDFFPFFDQTKGNSRSTHSKPIQTSSAKSEEIAYRRRQKKKERTGRVT